MDRERHLCVTGYLNFAIIRHWRVGLSNTQTLLYAEKFLDRQTTDGRHSVWFDSLWFLVSRVNAYYDSSRRKRAQIVISLNFWQIWHQVWSTLQLILDKNCSFRWEDAIFILNRWFQNNRKPIQKNIRTYNNFQKLLCSPILNLFYQIYNKISKTEKYY